MEQVSYTQKLADFVAETKFEDLPVDVVECTKRVILDTLGCIVGGFITDRQRILIDMARELGGRPEATILVTGDKVPCTNAALVNAESGNALEAEETFLNLAHFGPVIIASALATGERAGANGEDLITAVALGYDVNARLDMAHVAFRVVGEEFQAATCGGLGAYTIGAAVTAGKILGLDSEKVAQTIGIAGATAPSPSSTRLLTLPRLTMLKYGSMYAPAHTGVLAALLAEKGYIGDPTILDGDAGFSHFQGALDTDWELLIDELGGKWWILEVAYRVYPSCRYISAPLDLFYKIRREQEIRPEEIESVTVGINPIGLGVPSEANPWLEPDPNDPCTQLDSIFNIPYLISLAALGYKPGPQWYAPDKFANPEVRNLMKKVKVELDPLAAAEVMRALKEEPTHRFKKAPASVTVVARGRKFEARADYARGDPWLPETRLSDEELKDKFRVYTQGFVRTAKIEKAIESILDLERLDTVTELAELLTL